MGNLLIKDFILLKKNLLLLSILIPIFIIPVLKMYNTVAFSIIVTLISYMNIMFITAFDDKNKSEKILISFPLKKESIILERYLSFIIFAIFGILYTVILTMVLNNIGKINFEFNANMFFISLLPTFLLCVIYLPIYFKFGYLKSKFVLMGGYFSLFFGVPLLGNTLVKNEFVKQIINKQIIKDILNGDYFGKVTLIVFVLIVFYIISYLLSVKFYKARDL